MKVNSIESITPIMRKTMKKGVAIAAGIALGIAAGTVYTRSRQLPNQPVQDELVISMQNSNISNEGVVKGHEFNSKNDLEKQGKTKHLFAAKNGPDKGSKFYRSSEYNFFGYYKN